MRKSWKLTKLCQVIWVNCFMRHPVYRAVTGYSYQQQPQNGLFSSRPALIIIITNHVPSHPMNVIILHLNGRYGVQSESCFTHTLPVVTSPLNDGNHYFTMLVINGHGAWDLLIKTTNINEFDWCKTNFTTVKHVHNESRNFIESYDAHSDTNQGSNFIEMVLVSGMGVRSIAFLTH